MGVCEIFLNYMGSIAAAEVAKEVLGTLGKQKRPNITQIAIRKGYTPKTANSGAVQKTKSFKNVVAPVVTRWIKERERITRAMEERELTDVEYKDLAKVMDTLTQNIQLLQGGSTANIANQVLVKFIDAKDDRDTG